MIETLIKPQSLDNDIAVMKILQLLGQLSLNDIDYICNIVNQVHNLISEKTE